MFVCLFHFISLYHNAYVMGLIFDMSLPESYVYIIDKHVLGGQRFSEVIDKTMDEEKLILEVVVRFISLPV